MPIITMIIYGQKLKDYPFKEGYTLFAIDKTLYIDSVCEPDPHIE
jgi:hypothetical protein